MVDASHVYVRSWALGCFYSHISTRTFRRALTASLDSCTEIKSVPSVAQLNLAEFGGRCRKAVFGVCSFTWHQPYVTTTKQGCSHLGGYSKCAMYSHIKPVIQSDISLELWNV